MCTRVYDNAVVPVLCSRAFVMRLTCLWCVVVDVSPASVASNGNVYSLELLDTVALNLHRIDKDVQRCDRNYSFFTTANLEKLRNVICTSVTPRSHPPGPLLVS